MLQNGIALCCSAPTGYATVSVPDSEKDRNRLWQKENNPLGPNMMNDLLGRLPRLLHSRLLRLLLGPNAEKFPCTRRCLEPIDLHLLRPRRNNTTEDWS